MSQLRDNEVEQLQRQLQAEQARRAQVEEELLELRSNAAQYNATLHGGIALQRRRSNVSHALANSSMMAAGANTSVSQQRRAFSQQTPSSQTMRRTVSNRSEPGMLSLHLRPAGLSLDRPHASQDNPASRRLPSVSENSAIPDVGINPGVYVANTWNHEQSYLASTGTNLSTQDIYNIHAPSAPPSMISASSAAEGPLPITRENSSYGSSSAVNMARLASFRSQATDVFSAQDALAPSNMDNTVYPDWKNPDPNADFFAIGSSLSPSAPQQYPSPVNPHLYLSPTSAAMERSDSSASAMSTRSTSSQLERRAKEARERVLRQAIKAPIAPKPQQGSASKSAVVVASKEAKVALHKAKYQRPKHPKVHCTLCKDHPEGFRGDHELRRHINAKHEGVVKKFICRDPATVGIPSKLQVLYPLNKCKACAARKPYGAYYNAAAHLRRTHFRPKPNRGKSKVPMDERRGGKGGGDWPPMAELKAWFEEVRVHVDRSGALDMENDNMDDDVGSIDTDNIDLDAATNGWFPPMNDGSMTAFNFGDSNMSFGQDFPAASMVSGSDGTGISPLSSGSASFDYMSQFSQTTTGFNMMSQSNDGSFGGSAASANSSTPPAFQSMNNLTLSDVWEM